MSIIATFQVPTMTTCPPGNVYTNITQFLQGNVTISISDSGGTTVTQYSAGATPTPAAGAVWYRQNADAFHPFPMGIYGVYNGRWTKFTNALLGEVRWLFTDPTNLMDSTGLGLFIPANTDTPNIAGDLFGWALCNGMNGTVNLWNRVPIAGNKYNDSAAPNAWSSQIQQLDGSFVQQSSGGRTGKIPQNAIPPLNAVEYDATGNASTPQLYGGTKYTATVGTINPTTGAQQDYAPIYPLFRSVAAYQFIGYNAVGS